jgi:hypothetical protein
MTLMPAEFLSEFGYAHDLYGVFQRNIRAVAKANVIVPSAVIFGSNFCA